MLEKFIFEWLAVIMDKIFGLSVKRRSVANLLNQPPGSRMIGDKAIYCVSSLLLHYPCPHFIIVISN